jgi:hypothetical protein
MLLKLFDPSFLKKLQALQLNSRRASLMNLQGNFISGKRGTGIEFMEYKEYSIGDDFKHIDWNIYGRLDRLYVKLFHAERTLSVYIFFDASKSMLFPRKDKKFEYGLKTALALSYVGLISQNRVKIFLLGGESKSKTRGLVQESPFFYGFHTIHQIVDFLSQVRPGGIADLGGSVQKTIHKIRDVGAAIIISDFLMQASQYQRGISFLRFKNFDINAVHILGFNENNPFNQKGRLKVRDVETHDERIVYLSEVNLKKYQMALKRHQQELKNFCLANKAVYTLANTDTPAENFIIRELPRMKVLR